MRDVLFRGKNEDGEWVEGWFEMYPFGCWPVKAAIVPSGEAIDGLYRHIKVDPETVGQYTGVPDKNGRQMAEGDIVEGLFLFGMRVLGVVSFRNGAFGLRWYRGNVLEFSSFPTICNVEYEVIGNIYDNPELLGGADRAGDVR